MEMFAERIILYFVKVVKYNFHIFPDFGRVYRRAARNGTLAW